MERLRADLAAEETASVDELEAGVTLAGHAGELAGLESVIADDGDLRAGWEAFARLRADLLDQGAKTLAMQRQSALAELLHHTPHRAALRKFARALKTAQHRAKRELLEQVPVEVLLTAFPCWASTDRFLSHILPLRPGLFDLTVIDEASQVDQAAATPALFRGKRAVVVGDPRQLRFVSFLSASAEAAALARHDVPASANAMYRFSRRSLFDVADDVVSQSATFILDEHFRCAPHIISFSNSAFYASALRIMTERPHSAGAKAIEVRYVGGRRDGGTNRNEEEVNAAVAVVTGAVAEANRGGPVRTIGLLSPYRDQANALQQAVVATFSPSEIDRHHLTSGTAHSLQGDERDIVVLSTALDPGYHPGSLRFLEDPNLLNVAITRAAQQLIVVTSLRLDDLPSGKDHHLADFFRHADNPADPERLPDTFRSRFEQQVCEALRERGHKVISNYPSCGYEIDLVVSNGAASIAIECDGHPSHFLSDGSYNSDDVARHVVLSRAGWPMYRIGLSSWRRHAEDHVEMIERWLEDPPARGRREAPKLPPPAAAPARTVDDAPPTKKRVTTTTKRGPAPRSAEPKATSERVAPAAAKCSCGGRWVLRSGRYGKFYGCSRYPRCRRTRSAGR